MPNLPDLFSAGVAERHAAAEVAERDHALASLEERRGAYLKLIRAAMGRLYGERVYAVRHGIGWWDRDGSAEAVAWVSADDARRYFEALNPPAELSRNFLGQVFREAGWVALPGRRILSTTPGSHANELKCWAFDQAVAALRKVVRDGR